jgi:hypothetical protein
MIPCRIKGLKRGWYIAGTSPIKKGGLSKRSIFLGARRRKKSVCNGILFPATEDNLMALDAREIGYTRTLIDSKDIEVLGGLPDNAMIYYYQVDPNQLTVPSKKYPIVQSYVDVCLEGCIDVDNRMENLDYNFTKEFIKTTSRWNKHWINDRLYPRRSVSESNENLIDTILSKTISRKILWKIKLETK